MTTTPYRWKPGLPADRHRRRLNAKAAAGTGDEPHFIVVHGVLNLVEEIA